MCKLFALSTTQHLSKDDLNKLLRSLRGRFMAVSQKDGFGYAVHTSSGLWSEKFVKPDEFDAAGAIRTGFDALGALAEYAWRPGHVDYGDYNIADADVPLSGPLIVHGRTATNDVTADNAHPHIKKDWALVHNGVVMRRRGNKLPTVTTCDSEYLLNEYAYGNGAVDFHKAIMGYFATICISPTGELVISKDSVTDLHIAWSTKWQAFGFSTDEAVFDMLKEQAGFLKAFSYEPFVELTLRGNAIVKVVNIKPPTYASALDIAARKALGKPPTTAPATTTQSPPTLPTSPSSTVSVTPTQQALPLGKAHDDAVALINAAKVYNSIAEIEAEYGSDDDAYPTAVWARWSFLKHQQQDRHTDTAVS